MSVARVPHKLTGVQEQDPSRFLVQDNGQRVGVLQQELPSLSTVSAEPVSFADQVKQWTTTQSLPGTGGMATVLKIDLEAINPDALLGPEQAGLRDAKQLIDESKFKEALVILERVLRAMPGLGEALYLAGLCHFKLGAYQPALEKLRDLKDRGIHDRRRALQAEICEAVAPGLNAAFLKSLLQGNLDWAISEVKKFVDLDPSCGLYNLLYVGGMLTANRLPEALAAVKIAVSTCQDKQLDRLKALQREIIQRDLEGHLDGSRVAYRQHRYSKARKALDNLPESYRQESLWKTLRAYLESLGGNWLSRGLDPSAVKPAGILAQVNAMYGYLVREEIHVTNALLTMGASDQALQAAQAALLLAPHYGYAHYLFSVCIYKTIEQSWTGKREPVDPDTSLHWLEEARKHAEIASADSTVQHVQECLAAIATATSAIRAVKKEVERQIEEMRQVNVLRDEFQAVFTLAGEGISSSNHLEEVVEQLRKVENDARILLNQIRPGMARSYVERIVSATASNLAQLAKLEPEFRELDQIQELGTRLGVVLESVKGGLRDRQQYHGVKMNIEGLRREAGNLRRKINGEQSGKELDGLIKILDARLQELDAMQGQFEDNERLHPLLERFKELMESVNSRRMTPREFRDGLAELSQDVQKARLRLQTDPARKTLEQLRVAIDGRTREVAEMEAEADDAAFVNPLMEFFNLVMEGAQARSLDLDGFRDALTEMENQIRRARANVHSAKGRATLDQFERTIQGYRDQLRRRR